MMAYPERNAELKTSLTLILLLPIGACAAVSAPPAVTITESTTMSETTPPVPVPNRIRAIGTVRYQNLEGGFWGIVSDDGVRYDPMGLDAKFQREGLRVSFEAIPETDMMSTRMWGMMVTLTAIEPVK
jgi:hypothetical protein